MDDLIRRQDAIDNLRDTLAEYVPYIHGIAEAIPLECIKTIMQIPSAQQWIPCSERLPNSNGCYLVWRPYFFGGEIGMPSICYFDGQNTWHDSYGVDFERVLSLDDVMAWMPLPEPYKEEDDDSKGTA